MNKLIYISILTVLIACNNNKVQITQNTESTKDTIPEAAVVEAVYDSAYAKYAGIYESPFNEFGISFGKVTVKYITNNEIEFDLVTAHNQGSSGEIDGRVKIDTNGLAIFTTYDCEELTFQFSENQVEVGEKACQYHGNRSPFAGVYIRL